MIRLKEILPDDSGKLVGYHITRRKNLQSIKKYGLLPKTPEDFGETGDIEGIYFFPTIEDTKNALYNWLGERIDEWEEEHNEQYDEVCLKVDLSDVSKNKIEMPLDWEIMVTEKIPSDKILEVFKI